MVFKIHINILGLSGHEYHLMQSTIWSSQLRLKVEVDTGRKKIQGNIEYFFIWNGMERDVFLFFLCDDLWHQNNAMKVLYTTMYFRLLSVYIKISIFYSL